MAFHNGSILSRRSAKHQHGSLFPLSKAGFCRCPWIIARATDKPRFRFQAVFNLVFDQARYGTRPGFWEVVVTFQPARLPEPSPLVNFKSLFGFLAKHVDPIAFQRELRNEWDR